MGQRLLVGRTGVEAPFVVAERIGVAGHTEVAEHIEAEVHIVVEVLLHHHAFGEFELLEILAAQSAMKIPEGLDGLENKEILHKGICSRTAMKDEVLGILQIV